MNLYQLLEIEMSASCDDIKRAYFRLVRKYTPENNPEMFMKLRSAYEELTDDARRKKYDDKLMDVMDAHEDAAGDILHAINLAEKGLINDAVSILKKGKYSTQKAKIDAQLALCDIYMKTEQAGKAIKLINKLIFDNPDDPRIYEAALTACLDHGWTGKALEHARKLVEIDPGNEKGHLTILRESGAKYNPFNLGALVEIVESHGKSAPIICSLIVSKCLIDSEKEDNNDDSIEYEQSTFPGFEIEEKEKHETAPWDNIDYAFEKYSNHTVDLNRDACEFTYLYVMKSILPDIYNYDRYDLLPYVDRIIKNINREDIFTSPEYKLAYYGFEAILARKSGIPKIIVALAVINAFINSEACPEQDIDVYKNEAFSYEVEIILQLPHIKKQIKTLKNDFGNLYNCAADFFDKVLLYNENKMYSELDRRAYKYENIEIRLSLNWLGIDEYDMETSLMREMPKNEPVRSEKIGRNAPCPCNSGKKYKKCCGA